MWLISSSRTLVQYLLLKSKPSDVPYSRAFLVVFATGFVLVKTITDKWFVDIVNNYDDRVTVFLSTEYAIFMSLLWILLLYAIVRTALVYYGKVERLVQTMTTFLWVDLVISVVFFIWVAILSVQELPIQHGSFPMICLIISFLLMLYWQFMLYVHTMVYSLDITVLRAAIFTLCYMVLQYNISEILINFMVTVH